MTERGSETLSEIIGPVCKTCDGVGFVDNPDARYERDRDTGQMETNDPEEIDCPLCDGTGFHTPEPPLPPASPEEEIAF